MTEKNDDESNDKLANIPPSSKEIKELILHLHKHVSENNVDKLNKVYQSLEKSNPELATRWMNEIFEMGKHQRSIESRVVGIAEEDSKRETYRVKSSVWFSIFAIAAIFGFSGYMAYLGHLKLAVSVLGVAATIIGYSKVLGQRKGQSSKVSKEAPQQKKKQPKESRR